MIELKKRERFKSRSNKLSRTVPSHLQFSEQVRENGSQTLAEVVSKVDCRNLSV